MTALPASGSFTQVDPTHVAAVGPAAAILYARIEWRARETGNWRATRKDLADETGLKPETIRTALAKLRDEEWVSAQRASTLDATLVWTPLRPDLEHLVESTISTVGESPLPPGKFTISSTETSKTDTPTPGENPSDPPQLRSVPTTSDLDAEFEKFWALYPRHTARKAARTAYGRARRTASVEAIARGLQAQLPSLRQRDPQYVPHPTTWLNQGRWEDEVQPVRMASAPAPVGEVFTTQNSYDPAYEATLPPPRTDPFAVSW